MDRKKVEQSVEVDFMAVIVDERRRPMCQDNNNPEDQTPLTLGFVAEKALTEHLPDFTQKKDPELKVYPAEQPSAAAQVIRTNLVDQIILVDEDERVHYATARLTEHQVKVLKDVIHRCWSKTITVGRAHSILDGAEVKRVATIEELNPTETEPADQAEVSLKKD